MKISFYFIAIIFIIGCSGPITYTRLSNEKYQPKTANEIEVYIDDEPSDGYKKIAIISTNMWKENFATNVEFMKRKAAELGADAIIIFQADLHSSGGSITTHQIGGNLMVLGTPSATGYIYSAYAVKFVR